MDFLFPDSVWHSGNPGQTQWWTELRSCRGVWNLECHHLRAQGEGRRDGGLGHWCLGFWGGWSRVKVRCPGTHRVCILSGRGLSQRCPIDCFLGFWNCLLWGQRAKCNFCFPLIFPTNFDRFVGLVWQPLTSQLLAMLRTDVFYSMRFAYT